MVKLIHPWLLVLIPLPIMANWLLPRIKNLGQKALMVPFFQLIEQNVSASYHKTTNQPLWKTFIAWLIWFLLVIAAASPAWVGEPIKLPNKGRSIMLAIDISKSMKRQDMRVNQKRFSRLAVVKSAAGQFIQDRSNDHLGLILFGSNAYLRSPLTSDAQTLNQLLKNAAPGMAGNKTAIGDAIGLAIKRLKKAPKDNRVLILMTDGQNNAGNVKPMQAARMAAELNIRIYTIGLKTQKHMFMPNQGADNKTLKNIAKVTNGQFFVAGDARQLQNIYHSLDQIEQTQQKQSYYQPIKLLYPYPLGLALLISVLLSLSYIRSIKLKS